MKTVQEIRDCAHQLMLEALELLDKSDSPMSAIHIQWAIDLLPSSVSVTEDIRPDIKKEGS